MNDKNFDSLKNLKAPDSWIKNAKNIANTPTVQKEKPIFFIRYSRSLAAVACLVLVCTISLLVVLNKNDTPVLVVDPDFEIVETEDKNSESNTQTEHTEPTEIIEREKDDTKKDNINKKPVTQTQSNNGGAPHESTEKEENSGNHTNSDDFEKPTHKQETNTEKPTEKEEFPTQPTETLPAPTVRPTRPPNTKPEIKPVNRPNVPGDPEIPPPTDGNPALPGVPSIPVQDITFSIVVDGHYLTSGESFNCTIIGPDEEFVVTDAQAQISPYSDYALLSITVLKDQLPYSGNYVCYFFSSDGYYIGSAYSYA